MTVAAAICLLLSRFNHDLYEFCYNLLRVSHSLSRDLSCNFPDIVLYLNSQKPVVSPFLIHLSTDMKAVDHHYLYNTIHLDICGKYRQEPYSWQLCI